MRAVVLAAVAAVGGAREAAVGVCWTRNEVPTTTPLDVEPWREVRASAVTLRAFHPNLATCLFTDAPAATVDAAMAELGQRFRRSERSDRAYPRGRLFTRIVAQADFGVMGAYAGFGRLAARNATLAAAAGPRSHSAWSKIRSRLMRVHNVKRSPFSLTLFVDDDTVWCPHTHDLAARLAAWGPGADARFVPQSVAKGKPADAASERDRRRRKR